MAREEKVTSLTLVDPACLMIQKCHPWTMASTMKYHSTSELVELDICWNRQVNIIVQYSYCIPSHCIIKIQALLRISSQIQTAKDSQKLLPY